ncbi:hypothetical protein C1H76_5552 [Elsinoe australis]|uniref:Uncharacterized protein n=1 Tax=Elsinoe australis TaxID=40998 RepID=A0A4V6YAU3_9PEZI|nr:hypothetical protein C1H76_5552 [Elsinoe australis]
MKRMIDDVEGEAGANNPDAKKAKIDKTASSTQQLTVSTIRVIIDTPDLPAKPRRVFLSSLPGEIITKICGHIYSDQVYHIVLRRNGRFFTRQSSQPLGIILASKQFSSVGLRSLYQDANFVLGGLDCVALFCRRLSLGALDLITVLEVEQFAESSPPLRPWLFLGRELEKLRNLKELHVYMLQHVGSSLSTREIRKHLDELENELYLRRLLDDNDEPFKIFATAPRAWCTQEQAEQDKWLEDSDNYQGYHGVRFSEKCWVW